MNPQQPNNHPGWQSVGRRVLLGISTLTLSSALLVACGGAATSTTAPATATTAAPAASVARTSPAASAASASAPASAAASAAASASSSSSAAASAKTVQKVNANTATVAEMQVAFEAAGISNAARWAREVEEYRPYPTNDPTFAKLRGELAKYNPGPGVVDQIIAVLTLQ